MNTKKRKVIARKNLPTHVPLHGGLTLWLLMDRLAPPDWAWGVIWTMFAVYAIVVFVITQTDEYVEMTFPGGGA